MESTVSGTDKQEGRHDTQPLATSSAKTDTNLIETSRGSFIYTPAQLHENRLTKTSPTNYFTADWIVSLTPPILLIIVQQSLYCLMGGTVWGV